MNSHTYGELQIGHIESFTSILTKREMECFCEITGDTNPRHTECGVVYGMLTASYLSTLAGMYLPGKHSLILGVDVDFPNPHSMADNESVITVTGKVADKSDVCRLLILNVQIIGADGKKLLRGSMKVQVTEDE
jgi:hypothetical protein